MADSLPDIWQHSHAENPQEEAWLSARIWADGMRGMVTSIPARMPMPYAGSSLPSARGSVAWSDHDQVSCYVCYIVVIASSEHYLLTIP